MTKQYLLFPGDYYYPGGDFHDHIGSFDSIKKVGFNIPDSYDWNHIVDSNSLKIVINYE